MAIPYLKVEPEKAVTEIERWIVEGYQLKDKIVKEYGEVKPRFGDNSFTSDTIARWNQSATEWINNCLQDLEMIFVSLRELYNFRDSKPPFSATNENVHYVGIINAIDARIAKLNEYTNFIYHEFNIKFTVTAGRDAIVQTGHHAIAEVKNGD